MVKFIKAYSFYLFALVIFLSRVLRPLFRQVLQRVEIFKRIETDDGQSLVYDLYKPK